jgi:hypothetical protein
MRIKNKAGRAILQALWICVGFAAACKKSMPPPVPALAPPTNPIAQAEPPHMVSEARRITAIENNPEFTKSEKALLEARVPEEIAAETEEAKDRRELVLPPPPGWKPENVRRKIELTLIPENTVIHVGQKIRYQLKIKNVGRESLYFVGSYPNFIKDGELDSIRGFGFRVTPPGDKEKVLANRYMPDISALVSHEPEIHEYHFPDTMTAAEKNAAFERLQVEEKAKAELSVELKSGETLITRPNPVSPDKFRDLNVEFSFDRPGTYRLKAVYDNRPLPAPTEEIIRDMVKDGVSREYLTRAHQKAVRDSLGLVESNTIQVEIVP